MLNTYGFIWLQPGGDPVADRVTIERAGFRTILVPVSEPAAAVPAAAGLADEGVQLIELCGAFGPVWAARVLEATGHRVPVGAVAYGAESAANLAAIVQPADEGVSAN